MACLAHAVGGAVGDDDGGVVEEPVEETDRGGVLGEELAPLLERPVRCDTEGPAFVGRGDEPEEQFGAGGVHRREPDFVDQDQVRAQDLGDGLADGVVGQGWDCLINGVTGSALCE